MKTCTKCNINFPDNKRFCKKCGELLKPDSPIVNTQSKAENTTLKNIDTNITSSSKKQVLKYVLIGGSVVVIAFFTVFVILFLEQKSAWDEAKERNTLTSYQEYINEYPNGRYLEDAKLEIDKFSVPLVYDDNAPPPPPPPPDDLNTQEGVVIEDDTMNYSTSEFADSHIYTVVEEMPSYPGGDEARIKFLQKNIKYPQEAKENGIQGTVYVTFVVDENGKVTDPKVLRGIGGGCDEEAIRVVKLMPKWNAGKQSGKAVRVQFNMPIRFTLD